MSLANVATILLGLILARVVYVALPGSPAWSAVDAVLIGFPAYALACVALCALCRGVALSDCKDGLIKDPEQDEQPEDVGQRADLFV
jgi:hypothetical protein